jgi:2-polyprenyl-3-methyl-5-hydroxy-6-metoxy-1,4-benzoquinol methylase
MPVRLDPENNEIRALLDFAGSLAGRDVVEVGCGDGRLTWRYADRAAHVVGIDPNPDKIARARSEIPLDLRGRIEFHALDLETFAAGGEHTERFDLVILSWSL